MSVTWFRGVPLIKVSHKDEVSKCLNISVYCLYSCGYCWLRSCDHDFYNIVTLRANDSKSEHGGSSVISMYLILDGVYAIA